MEETAAASTMVRNCSPRLLRLLEVLARSDEPVKIDALSAALNTSRRTVFRELENAAEALSAFHTSLISVPGKGLILSGNGESRHKMLDVLTPPLRPISKQERLLRLLVELIANAGEVQKLFYYASVLNVSESTVSNDIDALEPWLSDRGISVTRKSGMGVQCIGTEEALRAALVSRFMTDGDSDARSYTASFGFPGEDIETGVREILRRKKDAIDWMTSESFSLIAVYLMVMVDRLRKGRIITSRRVSGQGSMGAFQNLLAEEFAAEMENQFSLKTPEMEQQALAGWIQACRSKQDSTLKPGPVDRQACIQSLTMRMIDRFDPPIAAILKTNEQLTRLLSLHLESALPRLRGGIALPNPLEEDLIKHYPKEYEKTRRAVKVLEEHLGLPVPSNEISFILIHFLAALVVLEERNIRRRPLRAGIVCVSGIGISYMLAYQVRKRFKGELEVEVADCDDKVSWADVDFFISTIPLTETDKPFVHVNTLLGAKDYQKIQAAIDTFAFTKRDMEQPAHSVSLEKRLDRLIEIAMQSRLLLDHFAVESIKAGCSFEELVSFVAERFAPKNSDHVRCGLMDREAVVTQVVGELGIVLLHIRTAYSAVPVFAVIVPEEGGFTQAYFKQTKSCVLMLLPETSPHEVTELMGGISSALIDLPFFLEAVRAGNREAIRTVLEREISETLARFGCGILT